jgi:iron-sulfur cluster repair protein YtfE (RIC family)
MAQSESDRAAAKAVLAHHAQLAAELTNHVTLLRDAAAGHEPAWHAQRQALLRWLRTDLLPHAAAEEAVLYPAAADQPVGKLLVDGMLAEHKAITALVGELEGAAAAVDAAAAGRALSTLFEVHLAKENDLIVPLLLDAGHVSLAGLLDGMHDLLGADDATEHV